jgi:hypothetical protein
LEREEPARNQAPGLIRRCSHLLVGKTIPSSTIRRHSKLNCSQVGDRVALKTGRKNTAGANAVDRFRNRSKKMIERLAAPDRPSSPLQAGWEAWAETDHGPNGRKDNKYGNSLRAAAQTEAAFPNVPVRRKTQEKVTRQEIVGWVSNCQARSPNTLQRRGVVVRLFFAQAPHRHPSMGDFKLPKS